MIRNSALILTALLLASCTKEVVTKMGADRTVVQQPEQPKQIEGVINGGGGKGVLCQKNGQKTLETLDLYEAKALYGLTPIEAGKTETEAIHTFSDLYMDHLQNPDSIPKKENENIFEKKFLNEWMKKIKFIEKGRKLKLVNDSLEALIEEGCEMVQVAIYYDESIVLIDKEYWNLMNPTNRIALLGHEIIYQMERKFGATSSVTSRKLIGRLFSKQGIRSRGDGIPHDRSKFVVCNGQTGKLNSLYFFAYETVRDGEAGVEFVFNYVRGISPLFRKSSFHKGGTLNSMVEGGFLGDAEAPFEIDTYPSDREAHVEFDGKGNGTLMLVGLNPTFDLGPYDLNCRFASR